MIEVRDLTRNFGAKCAVDNISFTVKDGEVLGFLGPNGAGKSTTMNMITGYLSSTGGTVTVDGCEILQDPIGVKRKIGYLPEHPPLYLDMTVRDYLGFVYDLKKIKLQKWKHIDEISALVRIEDVHRRLIKNLSKGYRQRVGLAQALLGDPGTLILDEPTVGLDPKQIIEIRSLIRDLGKKHTIILSSHILSEVQAACDRIIVINHGRLVADDTPDHLSATLSEDHRLTARIEGPEKKVFEALRKLPDMIRVDKLGEREAGVFEYLLDAREGRDIRRDLFRLLANSDWPLLGLRSSELTLEDVFLQLTDADTPEPEAPTPHDDESTEEEEGGADA